MWLSWLEHQPVDQKVTGPIPGQAHTQAVGSIPGQGVYEKATNEMFLFLTDVSLSLSLSL